MATPKTGKPVGRPHEFRIEYCKLLIEHMSKGYSFESFGAVARCGKTTLYNWLEKFPEFVNAKKEADTLSLRFYEELGLMISTGQLRRVAWEKPITQKDEKGNETYVLDAQGNIQFERKYEAATPGTAAWIFMMKNMHKWRDRQEVTVDATIQSNPQAIEAKYSHLTDDDVEKRFNELQRICLEDKSDEG